MCGMQFDRNKFKEIVLYVANNCAPANLGAVKLHKVLYFSDMLSFAFTGAPITGAVYRKRPHGPTADHLLAAVSELQREQALRVDSVDYFGYRKRQFTALRKPIDGVLSNFEEALLNDVIEFVCRENTAKTISEFSHQRPWDLVEFGDVIAYESAFLLFPEEVSEEALALTTAGKTELEEERSKSNPLGFATGADFHRQFRAM